MAQSVLPKVFVLVLSYNGIRWLEECLPSVLSMDYSDYEVVVIDNGSTDGTNDYLQGKFPSVSVVRVFPNRGYAGGFNAGLEYAAAHGAEYFLLMNNDTVIDRSTLRALVETATTKDRAGFVTGKVYFYDHPDILQTVGRFEDRVRWNGGDIGWKERDVGQYDSPAERIFVDDVYTLVSRGVYDTIGGYDSAFFLQCEEWDWQLRAKKEGWRIYYTPAGKLWHRMSATTGGVGSPINVYFLSRNHVIVLAKHGGARRVVRFVVSEGAVAVKRLIGALVRLDGRLLRSRAARLMGLLAGLWWLIWRQPATGAPWLIQRLAAHFDGT